jgi:two-component system NarL family response regulator
MRLEMERAVAGVETKVRILVVEDHRIVREGLILYLERDPAFEVIDAVGTGEDAVAAYLRHRPDVVLMDLQLPAMSGVDAIRSIRRADHDARVVVLTMYEGDEDIRRALDAGAATYLLKASLSDDLVDVVRKVNSGGRPLSPEVQARLVDHAARPALTHREVDVIDLVSRGHRNKEIAAALDIREETVEVHLKNIFAKLDVHDRTAAVRSALRRGIIHLE